MSRVREGRALVVGWVPIHRLVAMERLANLEYSKQDISRIMVRGGRHGRDRPPVWLDDGDMIVDLMTAGVAATSPAASVGSGHGATDFPPNGATSRSSGGDAPVTVTEPAPSMDSVQERIEATMRMLKIAEPKLQAAAYFLATCVPNDPASFEGALLDCGLSPVERNMVSKVWAQQNGWVAPGADARHAAVPEAPRNRFVAIGGIPVKTDPGDPDGVTIREAESIAEAQRSKLALTQVPVSEPDGTAQVLQTLGVNLGDLLRPYLGGEPVDGDSAVELGRLRLSEERWRKLQEWVPQVLNMGKDWAQAWRETQGGQLRQRVLDQGGAKPEPKEATNTVACSGCAELIDCPIGWTEFLCPACGAETILPGNNGEDVFADKNGFDEVGYVEKQTGPAPEGTGQDSDEPGPGESSRSRRSGVSAEARVGGADS